MGVEGLEIVEGLPRRILLGKALPLDQQLPVSAAQLSTDNRLRSGQQAPIQDWWHRRRCSRGIATPLLEQTDVENIMETYALGKLQAVGDLPNAFQNSERAGVARTEFALGRRRERVGGAVK